MAEGKQVVAKDLELEEVELDEKGLDLRHVRDQAEREAIVRALNHASGKISAAADLLGISRPTIYDLIRKFDLKV